MSEWNIVIHWTAGTGRPNADDMSHYHYLVDSSAIIHAGDKPVTANIPPLRTGMYVPHTKLGNSWAIGIGLCGMAGFSMRTKATKYPLTQEQCERGWQLAATLATKYGIPISVERIFTHAEHDKRLPKASQDGKIDIVYLPFKPDMKPEDVGSYIRDKVRWYQSKI